jgi:acyl-CoA synthetase (AMP-forming)/AMP-acid ligase II
MEINLAAVHEAIAAVIPESDCIVQGSARYTFAETTARTRKLAGALIAAGLGCHTEREHLHEWESGQDHVALLMHNSPEYLEVMLASYKSRTVPCNVNYRYVANELSYLLNDCSAKAIFFHSSYSKVLHDVLQELPGTPLLVQVPDISGLPLIPGAQWYDDVLANGDASLVDPSTWSPDDLYCCYTGGTTGMPKGAIWRQADIGPRAMQCFNMEKAKEFDSYEEIQERAVRVGGGKALIGPPLMHGAGHWMAFVCWHHGETAILIDNGIGFDADDAVRVIAREKITRTVMIGGLFATRLVEAVDRSDADLSSLALMAVGGAVTLPEHKEALLKRIPNLLIADTAGSTESGSILTSISTSGTGVQTLFQTAPGVTVLSEDKTRHLTPGDDEIGWLASQGRMPLGYLNDEKKTRDTFPVIDGVRWIIPGDRATLVSEGVVQLLGRDSVTINTGGEKVFAEEVEGAVVLHPNVVDCTVVGRVDKEWGNNIVAVLSLQPGTSITLEELREFCAERIARYKLPKDIIVVPEVVRGPAGKADYAWAKKLANPQ